MNYKLNMEQKEIDKYWVELKKERKELDDKYMKLVILEALNFLKKDVQNCKVSVERANEGSYFFSVFIYKDDDELYHESEYLRNILNQVSQEVMSEGGQWCFDFINNKEGQENLIKRFIGKNWETWLNDLKVIERYNDLSESLNENIIVKNKVKL